MRDRLIDDLLAEQAELHAYVSRLSGNDWQRVTAFFDWTVRDQILHLHQVDRFGLMSIAGDAPFADTVAAIRAHQGRGIELSAAIRDEFAHADDKAVLAAWQDGYRTLAAALSNAPDGAKVDWFGPPMGIASFCSARLMEVWAHGQDIYDLCGVRRAATPRIRQVCDLGVRTFGWSFRNRGLQPPPRPDVRLRSPDGDVWTWPGEGPGAVEGTALDFALVVTQRRAPQDTALTATGDAAAAWLPIAQCFAGAPQEPAAPGSRPPA